MKMFNLMVVLALSLSLWVTFVDAGNEYVCHKCRCVTRRYVDCRDLDLSSIPDPTGIDREGRLDVRKNSISVEALTEWLASNDGKVKTLDVRDNSIPLVGFGEWKTKIVVSVVDTTEGEDELSVDGVEGSQEAGGHESPVDGEHELPVENGVEGSQEAGDAALSAWVPTVVTVLVGGSASIAGALVVRRKLVEIRNFMDRMYRVLPQRYRHAPPPPRRVLREQDVFPDGSV
jgi:hypothetical protein